MRFVRLSPLLISGLLLTATPAFAHLGGISLQQKVGGFVIDADISAMQLLKGQEVLVSTGLITDKPWPDWDFAQYKTIGMTIRNTKTNETFTKTFTLDTPDFAFTPYTFPADGAYDLTLKFVSADGATVAEGTFPVTVPSEAAGMQQQGTASVSSLGFSVFIGAEIAVIVLAGIAFLYRRRWRSRTPS